MDDDEKKKSKEADKESEIQVRLEAILADELPKSTRDMILKVVTQATDDGSFELEVDGENGKKPIRIMTIGKGMILDKSGKLSDIVIEGDDLKAAGKALDDLPEEIRLKVEGVLDKVNDKIRLKIGEGIDVKGLADIKVDAKTAGKIVFIDSDGVQKTYEFGDGQEMADMADVLAKMPKEIAEKLKSVQIRTDREVAEAMEAAQGKRRVRVIRSGNSFTEKEDAKPSGLEKKLDVILSRLEALEAKVNELQKD
ncbi:MAG: hypothetical protein AAF802_27680 [Planctomycetota bacterium]